VKTFSNNKRVYGHPCRVISKNLKWGGEYRKIFGGCKHVQSANLDLKKIKNCKITPSRGVGSQLGGSLPP